MRVSWSLPAAEQLLRDFDVLGHADAAVHLDRLGEELAGCLAVAGGVAVEEHAGVEAADLWLLYDVRQILGAAQGGPEVLLRPDPGLAGASGDACQRI